MNRATTCSLSSPGNPPQVGRTGWKPVLPLITLVNEIHAEVGREPGAQAPEWQFPGQPGKTTLGVVDIEIRQGAMVTENLQ